MKPGDSPTPLPQVPPIATPVSTEVPTTPTTPANPVTPTTTTVVHVARPLEPEKQIVSPEVKHRHDRSVRAYPSLNLSQGEFVISAVRRHPIGLFLPLALGTIVIAAAVTVLTSYNEISQGYLSNSGSLMSANLFIPLSVLIIVVALGMFIAAYVYRRNRFFLTNESVIQEIQISLFVRKEQTVSLGNIEDASYSQNNILQHIFDYGDIRLSTEGDETTYRFSYVAQPKNHIALLNNAVEAFKNGRPVDDA